MRIPLKSGGYIRAWESRDLPVLIRCLSQEGIRKNLRSHATYPMKTSESPTHFAIVFGDQTIGGIGFDFDLKHQKANLGFWIDEPFRGKGIMSEAIPLISNWVQTEHRSFTLQSTVYGWNPASQKVLEKAGFVLAAKLPKAIHYADEITDLLIYEWDAIAQKRWEVK